MMRVATQGQQRSINDKARQAAVAKAIGATGQVAAQAYSANAAEVMKQAKELGLRSPEEIAGLKKVMEASARTGLSVEEIMNSDKMMRDLHKEAMSVRKKQDSLDEAAGELDRDVIKAKGMDYILDASKKMYGDRAEDALNKFKKKAAEEYPEGLHLPVLLAEEDKDKKISTYLDVARAQEASAAETEGAKQRLSNNRAERKDAVMSKEKLAQMAKLQALKGLGITGEGLTDARRAVAASQKLDSLASSNLVGRDMVGRMASEGSREGLLTQAKMNIAKTRADTATRNADAYAQNADTNKKRAQNNAIIARRKQKQAEKKYASDQLQEKYKGMEDLVKIVQESSVADLLRGDIINAFQSKASALESDPTKAYFLAQDYFNIALGRVSLQADKLAALMAEREAARQDRKAADTMAAEARAKTAAQKKEADRRKKKAETLIKTVQGTLPTEMAKGMGTSPAQVSSSIIQRFQNAQSMPGFWKGDASIKLRELISSMSNLTPSGNTPAEYISALNDILKKANNELNVDATSIGLTRGEAQGKSGTYIGENTTFTPEVKAKGDNQLENSK